MTRVTTYARRGNYCYLVDAQAAYDGLTLALSTLSNAAHYVSLYLYDNVSGTVEVSLNGTGWYPLAAIGGMDGAWVRYGASIPATDASGATRLMVRLTTNEDFYVDCVQVEQNTYGTTYIDGSLGAGYLWTGLYHGSTSTRSAQVRAGGRERNLLDDYGVEIVEGTKRIGTPPMMHSLQGQALRPGALYQSYKVLPREIELHLHYSADTWAGFHGKRQDVIDLLNPDALSGAQPIVIGYAGAGTTSRLYCSFYYNGGLEFGDFLAYDEVSPVRLLAPDPFWYEDNQEVASLDYQDSLTNANYLLARLNGRWQSLGTGASGSSSQVTGIAVSKTGKVYHVGDFGGLNGVSNTADSGYWNGSTFVSLGTATAGGYPFGVHILPSGYAVAFGSFTSIGGVSNTSKIAAHNGTTWTAWGNATGGDVVAITTNPANGRTYVGGAFTNIGGSALSNIAYTTDGSTYTSAGSPGGTINNNALAMGRNGLLYAGVNTANAFKSYDGSTWTTIASYSAAPSFFTVAANGDIYYRVDTGVTSKLYRYNGSYSQSILDLSADNIGMIKALSDGTVIVGLNGAPTIAGITYSSNLALWNGARFVPLDVVLSVTPTFYAFAEGQSGIYAGWGASSTGTATTSGVTSVSNGSTVKVSPVFTIIGPSSGSCVLQWLENQTTGHRMYFYLTIYSGETVTIDCEAGTVVSDWRGTITDNPLDASNFTTWRLLPGSNTVAAFITGTITEADMLARWQPRHMSADGAA